MTIAIGSYHEGAKTKLHQSKLRGRWRCNIDRAGVRCIAPIDDTPGSICVACGGVVAVVITKQPNGKITNSMHGPLRDFVVKMVTV